MSPQILSLIVFAENIHLNLNRPTKIAVCAPGFSSQQGRRQCLFNVVFKHVKISQLVNKMCSQQACSNLSFYQVACHNLLSRCNKFSASGKQAMLTNPDNKLLNHDGMCWPRSPGWVTAQCFDFYSRKYFIHLNWIRLVTNPSRLDSSMGRNPKMRVRIPRTIVYRNDHTQSPPHFDGK